MSNKKRYCLLCQRHDGRTSRRGFIKIRTIEREEKLREGYRCRSNGEEINETVLNQFVHRRCYNKTIEKLPSIDQSHSTDNLATNANEQNQDGKHHQESEVQPRPTAVLSNGPKSVQERSKASCVICHSYGYTRVNPITQVASNSMAEKLAHGYLHRYKRPYGKSFLDAYMHKECYKKIHSSSRNQQRSENRLSYQPQMIPPVEISPHRTRSQSGLNRSDQDASIVDLLSTPLNIPAATTNPNVELSARSCLFRPCIERLRPEQVEFYSKRNTLCEDNPVLDSLPITSTIQRTSPLTASFIDDPDPMDFSANDSTFIPPPARTVTTAEIRYLHSKPSDSRPMAHNPIINAQSKQYFVPLDKLHQWLIEQLKSSEYPLPISEVLTKYHEFIVEEGLESDKSATLCRVRLRNRLEKFYPNEFAFVVPNKRDGTYIALNDLNHYVCSAIKKAHDDKDKATKTSMVSSIIAPPTPDDHKRQTCEAIMNGIRKIRLYIHDSKQINCRPSHLMENFIGLITASDRQFDKISHNYDFYRMIDENLFDCAEDSNSKKLNRTIRNMSLASDLLSARHDHQISQKHYLLADEIANESFHCTPREVISLLNRYGHTCSYRSYKRMRRTTEELTEALSLVDDQASDVEIDMIDL